MANETLVDTGCVTLEFKGFPGNRTWKNIVEIKFWVFSAVAEPTSRIRPISNIISSELNEIVRGLDE